MGLIFFFQPTQYTPALPSLTKLEFERTAVDASNLASLVYSSARLEYLSITNPETITPFEPHYFKYLLSAVRRHKKPLEFRVQAMQVDEEYTFSCHVHTAHPVPFMGRNVYEEEEAKAAAEAYLTRTVKWIRPLLYTFDGMDSGGGGETPDTEDESYEFDWEGANKDEEGMDCICGGRQRF